MIEYYVGTEGVTVNIESAKELQEALDIMHTQVMDNIGENSPLLRILETAIDHVQMYCVEGE